MKWISVFAMLFIFSCKKEKTNNTSLVGKWKTIEIYQGYVMGGCFCWKLVESQDAPILEFSALGRYTLTQPPHFSVSGCSGNYRIVTNDSTLSDDLRVSVGSYVLKSIDNLPRMESYSSSTTRDLKA